MMFCFVHVPPARPFDTVFDCNSGEVRLDESVEQPQELKSSLSLQVHDETEELSLEYPENVLTVSETVKKTIHGSL